MKFIIEYTNHNQNRLLKYIIDEYSFDSEPTINEINFEIVLNKLSLTVSDNNEIVQVLGFCPYGEWIKGDYDVPKSRKGLLKVKDNFDPGFSYKVNKDKDFSIYVNVKTGWVCIGNPEEKGNAVEFMNNCIACINDNEQFISLWLKPEELPNLK